MKTTTKAIAVAMALSMPAAAVGATIYEKDGSRLTIGAKFYVNATSSRTEEMEPLPITAKPRAIISGWLWIGPTCRSPISSMMSGAWA